MIAKLLDGLFGCWHSRYSFPITVRARSHASPAAALTGTYVVCLDCGKEMPYDWSEMKVLDSLSQVRNPVTSLATKHAA
jgi:hypothetical protein